jgi:hypothetical protein
MYTQINLTIIVIIKNLICKKVPSTLGKLCRCCYTNLFSYLVTLKNGIFFANHSSKIGTSLLCLRSAGNDWLTGPL